MNTKKAALAGAAAIAAVGFTAASASAAAGSSQVSAMRGYPRSSFTIQQVSVPAAHITVQGPDFKGCCRGGEPTPC